MASAANAATVIHVHDAELERDPERRTPPSGGILKSASGTTKVKGKSLADREMHLPDDPKTDEGSHEKHHKGGKGSGTSIRKQMKRLTTRVSRFVWADDEKVKEPAIKRLQELVRGKICHKRKLSATVLLERLRFERSLLFGTLRMLNFVFIFLLLSWALSLSDHVVMKRGIYVNLDSAFSFEDLGGIQTRAALKEGLKSLADTSKDFLPLSTQYFEEDAGHMELLHDLTDLTGPLTLTDVEPRIDTPSKAFSFVSWVKRSPKFQRGYIVRKQAENNVQWEGLSCWGWFLDYNKGPSLSYAAHDRFDWGASAEAEEREMQYEVSSDSQPGFPVDQWALLAMVVEGNNVTFYENISPVGTYPLPQTVTDCSSNPPATIVGDAGLSLGELKFFPYALHESQLDEVYRRGAQLSQLASGYVMHQASSSSEQELLNNIVNTGSDITQAVGASSIISSVLSMANRNAQLAIEAKAEAGELPRAPPGPIFVDLVKQLDTRGRYYYSLLKEPASLALDSSWTNDDARYFDPSTWPSWYGTGATYTFWLRPGDFQGYIMYSHLEGKFNQRGGWCIFIQADNIVLTWQSPTGSQREARGVDFVNKKYQLTKEAWRHIGWQFDHHENSFKFYLDGKEAYKYDFGNLVNVTNMDWSPDGKIVAFGQAFPGNSFPTTGDISDVRVYIPEGERGDLTESPLSAEDIYTLAFAVKDHPPVSPKCKFGNQIFDRAFSDINGNNCEWYYNYRDVSAGLCEGPSVRDACPIACASVKECLDTTPLPNTYEVWENIRYIKRLPHLNGTICLRDDQDIDAIIAGCEAWVTTGAFDDAWEQASQWFRVRQLAQANGYRLDLKDCQALRESVNPHCSFAAAPIKEFEKEAKESKGDFTMAFWARSSGGIESLNFNRDFVPQMTFYSSLSEPQHNMAFIANGGLAQVALSSSCHGGTKYLNIQTINQDGWTFVSVTRFNSTALTIDGGKNQATYNEAYIDASTSDWPMCFYDDFITAIEISQDMLVTPILLIPKALNVGDMQQYYYKLRPEVVLKNGPITSAQEVAEGTIGIAKNDFLLKSILISPPVVVQTRNSKTQSCPFRFSDDWLQKQHNKALKERCAWPYSCDTEMVEEVESVVSCMTKESEAKDKFFGLRKQQVGDIKGYTDLLYSYTDHSLLFRQDSPGVGGVVQDTDNFVDIGTSSVSTFMVFYSPQYGITSVLSMKATMDEPIDVKVEVDLQHYEILERSALTDYLTVQSMSILGQIFLFADNIRDFSDILEHYGPVMPWHRAVDRKLAYESGTIPSRPLSQRALIPLLDLSLNILLAIFSAQQIPVRTNSASEVERVVGDLSDIDWADQNTATDEAKASDGGEAKTAAEKKLDQFFSGVQDLLKLINKDKRLNATCNVVLFVLLLRMIIGTSIHPRLNLLTGTLIRSLDDLWHTGILLVLVMVTFAMIAQWRFGSFMEEFSTLDRALQTQMEMLLSGELMDGWNGSTDLIAYTIMFALTSNVLILNFVLAIIVESYMGILKEIEDKLYEMEFFTDVWLSILATGTGLLNGWPSHDSLVRWLESQPAKLFIGFSEVSQARMLDEDHIPKKKKKKHDNRLFRTQWSSVSFLNFYAGYDFLEASLPEKPEREFIVDDVEERIAWLLGKIPPTYTERLQCMSRNFKKIGEYPYVLDKEGKLATKAFPMAYQMNGASKPESQESLRGFKVHPEEGTPVRVTDSIEVSDITALVPGEGRPLSRPQSGHLPPMGIQPALPTGALPHSVPTVALPASVVTPPTVQAAAPAGLPTVVTEPVEPVTFAPRLGGNLTPTQSFVPSFSNSNPFNKKSKAGKK